MSAHLRYVLKRVGVIVQSKLGIYKAFQKPVLREVVGHSAGVSHTTGGLFRQLLPAIIRQQFASNSSTGSPSFISTARRHLTPYWPNMWRTFRSFGFNHRAANNPSTKLLYLSLGFCGMTLQHQQTVPPIVLDIDTDCGENMTDVLRHQWTKDWTKQQNSFRLLHDYASKLRLEYVRQSEALQDKIQSAVSSLGSIKLGPYLAKGCDGALCAASVPQENGLYKDVVIKMLFNYNGGNLDFAPEALPLRLGICHENIIRQYCEFQDENILHTLTEAREEFPVACRADLHPFEGNNSSAGAKELTYIVMEKHDVSLDTLLQSGVVLNFTEIVHVLVQLLEALLALQQKRTAHRDIKLDNILVSIDPHKGTVKQHSKYSPYRIILADLGHCATGLLGDDLRMSFTDEYTSRGGNRALMAPEICCARPSSGNYLSYGKSDLWSVGTLVYDLLGLKNPFWGENKLGKPYKDSALPPLRGVPEWFDVLIRVNMLSCDPKNRLPVRVCANILQFYLLQFEGFQGNDTLLSQLWQRFLSLSVHSEAAKYSPQFSCFEDVHKPFFARVTSTELLWCVYWFQSYGREEAQANLRP